MLACGTHRWFLRSNQLTPPWARPAWWSWGQAGCHLLQLASHPGSYNRALGVVNTDPLASQRLPLRLWSRLRTLVICDLILLMLFLHFEKELSQLPFFGKQGPKFSMSIWEENKEDCL